MATIQGIYIALFGRPADPVGLAFFNEATNNGADLSAIGDLAGTAEYQNRFEGMSNADIVTAIYQSLFGRNPELAGLQFFVAQLESGAQNINTIAINILDGAQGDDALVVENKIEAANAWTAAVAADPDALAAYRGQTGIDAGVDYLSGITADPATIPSEAQLEAALGALVDGSVEGDTFVLTTGRDNFQGTDDDDTFEAVLGTVDGQAATLNAFDNLDGGRGNDVLNIYTDGTVAVPGTANISNIETVNFLFTDAAAPADTINAARFQGAQEIWQVNAATNISGLAAGQVAGFRDTDANTGSNAHVVTAAAGAASVSVALDAAGQGTDAEFALSVAGADVTTLNISGTVGEEAGKLSLTSLPVDLETVNLELHSDTDIAAYSGAPNPATDVLTTVTTFDASASTGDLVVGLAGLSGLAAETILLGSGDDSMTLSLEQLTADELVVGLGAGDDTIAVNLADGSETVLSISGGAGDDTFVFGGGNIALDEDGELEGSVTITDFNEGNNLLVIEAFDGFTAQTAVNNAIRNAETLEEALAALESLTTAGGTNITSFAQFEFEGNTYVYGNVDSDSGLEGDLLVGFSGIVDLNNNNVVELGVA